MIADDRECIEADRDAGEIERLRDRPHLGDLGGIKNNVIKREEERLGCEGGATVRGGTFQSRTPARSPAESNYALPRAAAARRVFRDAISAR